MSDEGWFVFKWSIKNFSMFAENTGKKLKSPIFLLSEVEDSTWYLTLYPKGEKDEGFIALDLYRKGGEPKPLTVHYKLILLPIVDTKQGEQSAQILTDTFEIDEGFGFQKFYDRNKLFLHSNVFLPNDVLSVMCFIKKAIISPQTPPLLPYSQILQKVLNNTLSHCSAITHIVVLKSNYKWCVPNFNWHSPPAPKAIAFTAVSPIKHRFLLFINFSFFKNEETTNVIIEFHKDSGYFKESFFAKYKITFNYCGKNFILDDSFLCVSENENELWLSSLAIDNNLLPPNQSTLSLLTISAEFAFSKPENYKNMDAFYTQSILVPKAETIKLSCLNQNLQRLYEEGKFCDVELEAGNESVSAHKAVLCAMSPVFEAMFDSNMREKISGVVHIEDVEYQTIQKMVSYLYTQTLEENMDAESMLKLYIAADKYGIVSLKEHCSQYLMTTICRSNICKILSVADIHQDKNLWEICLKFVQMQASELFTSSEWEALMEKNCILASKVMHQYILKHDCC